MARRVVNYLKAHGDPAEVRRFYAEAGGSGINSGKALLDFSGIAPTPSAMDTTMDEAADRALVAYANAKCTGVTGFMQMIGDMGDYGTAMLARQKAAFQDSGGRSVTSGDTETLALGEKLYNNIREYGAPSIAEWRAVYDCASFPAYDQERADDSTVVFNTPKNGVPELIQALSARHPAVTLSYCHADEERGKNAAQYEFEGGGCTFMNRPDDDTPEAKGIAAAVFGDYENEGDALLDRAAALDEETSRILDELFADGDGERGGGEDYDDEDDEEWGD